MKQQIYSTNFKFLEWVLLERNWNFPLCKLRKSSGWENGRKRSPELGTGTTACGTITVCIQYVYIYSSDYVQLPEVLSSQWSYQVWFYSAFSETKICERKPKEIGILRSLTPLAALWSNVFFLWVRPCFDCSHACTQGLSHVCKQTIYMIMSMVSCYSTDLQVMVMCHSAMHYQKQGRRLQANSLQMFHEEGNAFKMFVRQCIQASGEKQWIWTKTLFTRKL